MILEPKYELREVCFDGGDPGCGLEHVYNMFTYTSDKPSKPYMSEYEKDLMEHY